MGYLLLSFITIAFIAVTITGCIYVTRIREERDLINTLRAGREFDGIILDAFPLRPVLFHSPNVWLRVLLFAENGHRQEIKFAYESTCLEWSSLFAGNRIRVELDPDNPGRVHIISPQQHSQPALPDPYLTELS